MSKANDLINELRECNQASKEASFSKGNEL